MGGYKPYFHFKTIPTIKEKYQLNKWTGNVITKNEVQYFNCIYIFKKLSGGQLSLIGEPYSVYINYPRIKQSPVSLQWNQEYYCYLSPKPLTDKQFKDLKSNPGNRLTSFKTNSWHIVLNQSFYNWVLKLKDFEKVHRF